MLSGKKICGNNKKYIINKENYKFMVAIKIILALLIVMCVVVLIYVAIKEKELRDNEIIIDEISNDKTLIEKESSSKLEEQIKELDTTLENPEYISKEEKEKQSVESEKFMASLQNLDDFVVVNSEIKDDNVVKEEEVVKEVKSEESTEAIATIKPKRKYTPRKKKVTTNEVEVKIESNETENN